MTLRQFWGIVEIRTKIVSLSTYFLATSYVIYRTGELDFLKAVLMLLATLFVDMGTTAFNSFFDYWHGVDDPRFNREVSKVVVHEGVPGGYALIVSLGLFAMALPLGLVLARLSGWSVLWVGALCMAVGFLYTGGPFPISRTPFGEIFAGGFLGSVLFLLIWYIQVGSLDASVIALSLPSTLAIAAILTVNNTCDIDGDTAAGRRTLSILLGRSRGEAVAIIETVSAFGLLAVYGFLGLLPWWAGIVTLPFGFLSAMDFRSMHRRGYSHESKGPNMGGISKIFLLFSLALFVVIVLGSILSK